MRFRDAMALMRRHDPQASEDGFHHLLPHAAEHISELLAAFATEHDPGLRRWLLELIAAARSPDALPLLVEQLSNDDEAIRDHAVQGLTNLNTPQARRELWKARSNGTIA